MADEWGDDGGDDWGDEDGGDDWGDDGGDDWGDGGGGDPNAVGVDDGGAGDSWEIQVENLYYTAEPDIKADPQCALDNFLECIKLEEENSKDVVKFRFNALKNVVLILYGFGSSKKEQMISSYNKLLSISHLVSPNDLNNAIRSILNTIQESSDKSSLESMYSMTLEFFKNKAGKERVWFEFAMRLCKTYLDSKKNKECESLLDELHLSCKIDGKFENEDDLSKGGQLLEIYSIKIQLMAAANNRVALAELFERTNTLCADVNDPRSMSVIKECWGKMYASMNQFDEAYTNFFDAFRSYQDIGHQNVKKCLKYVVISSMLCERDTNPFATQEAAVFKTNSEIMPISNLLESFDNDNINRFESTLKRDKHLILNDDFIVEHMPAVKLKIRSKVLVKLIKPYTRVKLQWLCKQLNATMDEIENLVVNLILDGSVNGRLDQIHSLLDLNYSKKQDKLYGAMDNWLSAVNRLRNSISTRTGRQDFGGRGGMGGMHHFGGGGMMDFDMLDDDFYGQSGFGINDDFMGWMG
mmetsp:Transcript_46628/g.41698  ORF Transcript_46628/g.41698 Transcript_46628/m.41698 type:complete len:525 (+) Transcript_46628:88-1662(+)